MKPTRSIIYYTDNRLDDKINTAVQQQLLSIGLPIVSASLQPIDFGTNFHVPLSYREINSFTEMLKMLQLEYDMCKMQQTTSTWETGLVQELSRRVYEKLAKNSSSNSGAEEKRYLSELVQLLLENGYLEKRRLQSLPESELPNAPPRLQQAQNGDMDVSRLPLESSQGRRKSQGELAFYSPLVQNYWVKMERGYHAYFTQIVTALENSTADIVYFCEHDNLMHPSHFDFTPPTPDKFYYDLNWWKVRADGLAVHWDAVQVSGLVCYRSLALKYYASRLATFDPENFDRKFEPTVDTDYETYWAEYPSIDIRHDKNLTYNKWKLEHFRNKATAVNFQQSKIESIPGWENLSGIINKETKEINNG